jgi:uncharacterized protein (TIGR02147 family)
MPDRSPIDVFAYADYRHFLAAYYAHRKASDYGFSYRSFARAAGFSSPNYLKLVIDGKRNLTDEMAQRFAAAIGLSGQQLDYFCELVAFNQARNSEQRARHYERLRSFQGYKRVHVLDADAAAYHSQWYIPAIRELAACRDFRADPKWIAARLVPRISARAAREGLDVLVNLGLLVPDKKRGYKQHEPIVSTPPNAVLGHHIATYHRALLERAAESIDLVPRDQRELGAVTLSLNATRIVALKRELVQFRDSILQRYGADTDGTRVVQLNYQMFPLSTEETDSELT